MSLQFFLIVVYVTFTETAIGIQVRTANKVLQGPLFQCVLLKFSLKWQPESRSGTLKHQVP